MYLSDVVASLRRRKLWLLAAIVVTLASCAAVVAILPPTYQYSASVVLVPPPSPDAPKSNRYLSLGGLNQASSVLIRALNSDATHQAVDGVEPRGTFEVTPDYTTSAPIVVLTTKADADDAAKGKLAALMSQVPRSLERLQATVDIASKAQITAVTITRDDVPTVIQKKRLRGAVAVGLGLAVVLSLGIAALDGLLLRRRRRAGEDEEGSTAEPALVPPSLVERTAPTSRVQRQTSSGARRKPSSPPPGSSAARSPGSAGGGTQSPERSVGGA